MKINKNVLITLGSVFFIFVLLYGVYLLINKPADYTLSSRIIPGDHVKWSPAKKNILVEYSDLQCPACKSFNDLLLTFEGSQSAQSDIPAKITLVYRHFPLYQIHENAFKLAYAVEAAGKQDKFFEMVDAIYSSQDELEKVTDTEAFVMKKASGLGLDVKRFKNDMDSAEVKSKVDADLAGGESMGISSTPTFFLNGQKLSFRTVEEFVNILRNVK